MNNIRAIIFDLDGVIVSTDTLHYKAWKRLADELNIPFDQTINDRLRGISRMESLDIILENSATKFSISEKQAFAEKKNSYYLTLLELLTPADVLPDVCQTLQALRDMQLLLGIASSSKNAKIILNKIGMNGIFDVVSDGNNIIKSKPDPEVFLKSAKMLNIPAQNCIGVDDAVAGVQSAKAAGMTAAAIGNACGQGIADHDITNFSQLLQLI